MFNICVQKCLEMVPGRRGVPAGILKILRVAAKAAALPRRRAACTAVAVARQSKIDRDAGVAHAFLGACLLTAAFLLPHVAWQPVLAGMAVAGLIRWGWSRRG